MALIDRVKERTGSDLSDDELNAMIAAIEAELDARFGPVGEVVVSLGDLTDPNTAFRRTLKLDLPLDQAEPVTIVEISPGNSGQAASQRTISADDYRVLHGGRTLQRLTGGPNGASYWAPLVDITYTPKGVAGVRDEAVIRLMGIETTNKGGLKSERAGDYSYTLASGAEQAEAREAVFTWLSGLLGSGGLTMA